MTIVSLRYNNKIKYPLFVWHTIIKSWQWFLYLLFSLFLIFFKAFFLLMLCVFSFFSSSSLFYWCYLLFLLKRFPEDPLSGLPRSSPILTEALRLTEGIVLILELMPYCPQFHFPAVLKALNLFLEVFISTSVHLCLVVFSGLVTSFLSHSPNSHR